MSVKGAGPRSVAAPRVAASLDAAVPEPGPPVSTPSDPAASFVRVAGTPRAAPVPAVQGQTRADPPQTPMGLRMAVLRGADPVAAAASTQATVSVEEIRALQAQRGAVLTVSQLAELFPRARINGAGLTLTELAAFKVNKTDGAGGELTLGDATVDKNGDVDVTRMFRAELTRFNQHLVIHKGDEHPVPLEYSLRHGDFRVADPAHQQALSPAGFARTDAGHVTFDLRDMEQVGRALRALGVDPADDKRVSAELASQGVSVRLSRDDQLRRVVCGLLDSVANFVDIDDRLVDADRVGDHNGEFKATVYASAKVNPSRPEHVVLAYKRFNNQSFSAQGGWVANALGKDRNSQHEGDMETTFLKVDSRSHELEAVLAARHSYGELYDREAIARVRAETGSEVLAVAVSYKAHGSDLAGARTRKTFAGHGEDGVTPGDWKDHVLPESFPGIEDARRGDAQFIPRERIRLVLEADDQQTLNMKVRLGDQRRGLMGTGLLDMFNDGVRMDRFMGTGWFYRQEELNRRS